MHSPYAVPGLSTTRAEAHELDVDAVVIPVAQDAAADLTARYAASVGPALASAIERGEFRGAPTEVLTVQAPSQGWRASRVLFVGGGPRRDISSERLDRKSTRLNSSHT